MPRYFFNIVDGRTIDDGEGVTLADDGEARQQAMRTATEILQHEAMRGWDGSEWRMTVFDESGRCVFTLCFSTPGGGDRAWGIQTETLPQPRDIL